MSLCRMCSKETPDTDRRGPASLCCSDECRRNRENQCARLKRLKNIEARREQQRKHYAANPNKWRAYRLKKSMNGGKEYQQRYYQAHRDKCREKQRARQASGATRLAWQKWIAANRDKERYRNRERMRAKRGSDVVLQAKKTVRLARIKAKRQLALQRQQRRAEMVATRSERRRARRLAYNMANRAANNARTKRWREANPERVKALMRSWIEANPAKYAEHCRAGQQNRRARLVAAFVEHVDPVVLYERDRGVCGICRGLIDPGQPWEIDHVIPLAKGGKHHYGNVQVSHVKCNRSKGAKLPEQLRRAG